MGSTRKVFPNRRRKTSIKLWLFASQFFNYFFFYYLKQTRCVLVRPDLCIDFLWYIHWRSSASARQNSEAIKRLIGLTFSNITERFRSQENRRQMKKLSPWRLSWSRARRRERCLAALPSEFRIISTFEAQNTEICALVKNCVSPGWLLLPIIHLLQLNWGLFISSWDLFKVNTFFVLWNRMISDGLSSLKR